MARLSIENFSKHYGEVKAVDDVSITVKDGEFLTLLGPSGCGKSTTLFAIAGLDKPTLGNMYLNDQVFCDVENKVFLEPEKRNCGLVFQSYALWPHMTVRKNLDFPLKLRKVGKQEKEKRIKAALALVEMEGLIDRYPHELSGGQQQRVALARTLIYEPQLLLLDEPLSNLDAKLRIKARIWLKSLTESLNLTTVYVTHDQTEALSLSDRIAIMNNGKLVQLDTPENIYKYPANAFVADFMGNSNFLTGTVSAVDEAGRCTVKCGEVLIRSRARKNVNNGDKVTVSIRPENISLSSSEIQDNVQAYNTIDAKLESSEYLGARFEHSLRLADGQLMRAETAEEIGSDVVTLYFLADDCIVFNAEE